MQRGFRAARAAALLLIASGAGGAASAYLPQLDARWIFVGAVALIAAIDGMAFGIAAAIVATFAYEIVVHASLTFVPSRDTLTLVASLAAAILIGGGRALLRRPRLRETHHRMLLPAHVEMVEEATDAASSSRVEELEARLAETQMRFGALSTKQLARISELETELSDARGRIASTESRFAKRDQEHSDARALAEASINSQRAQIADLERQLAEACASADASIDTQRAHIADIEGQLADMRGRVAELEPQLAQRERDLADTHANADASINSQRAQIAELETERASARSRVAELERSLGEGALHVEQFERTVDSQRTRIAELEQSLEETRELHRRAAADHDAARRRIAEGESQSEDLQEAMRRSNERIAELESELAESVGASDQKEAVLEAARATSASLAARVAELEEAIESEREKLEAEFSEKLNTIVTHLASDHEADLGDALMEREAARAEVRDLTARMAELKRMLDERSAPPEHGFAVVNLGEAKKRSVLLIHRDAMLRTTAKRALERDGYKVTTASDGLEALRIAMTEKPDVVLADTQMPKMDGRALVQLLKSRSETAEMKIVLIGIPITPNEDGSEFRADDFIRDPSNVESLKSTIENVLAVR